MDDNGQITIRRDGERFELVATNGEQTASIPLQPEMLYALSLALAKQLSDYESRRTPQAAPVPIVDIVSPAFSVSTDDLGVVVIFSGHALAPN